MPLKVRSGGELTHHREYKPPQVSVDGQVDHLLDWVEVWIIQVPQEPQHTRPEHLQPQKHVNLKGVVYDSGENQLVFELNSQ